MFANFFQKCFYTIILFCNCFIIVACGPEQPTIEERAEELTKILPKKIDVLNLEYVEPHENEHQIYISLKLDAGKQADSYKKIYENTFEQLIKEQVCNGERISYPHNKFINDNLHIHYFLKDNENKSFYDIEVTKDICKNFKKRENFDRKAMQKKQEEQGYFDENYIQKVYVQTMKANLPQEITPEIVMVDAISGPGSKLSFVLNYTPKNPDENRDSLKSKSNIVLQKIYYQACKDDKTKEVISQIEKTTWIMTYKEKVLTSLVASRTCK